MKKEIILQLGHTSSYSHACYSPDLSTFATSSWDGVIRLYCSNTSEVLKELRGHFNVVNMMVFSNDGRYILSASDDNTARLWDLEFKKPAKVFEHSDAVNTAVFNSAEDRILTSSDDHTAKIWNIKYQEVIITFSGNESRVNAAYFLDEDDSIITSSYDGSVNIWDSKTSKNKYSRTIKKDGTAISQTIISPDRKGVFIILEDETAQLWELTSNNTLIKKKGKYNSVMSGSFSLDNKYILAVTNESYDLLENSSMKLINKYECDDFLLSSAVFASDKDSILLSSMNSIQRLSLQSNNMDAMLNRYRNIATSMAIHPETKQILIGYKNGYCSLIDYYSKNKPLVFEASTDSINYVDFNSSGNVFITSGDECVIKLWDYGKKVIVTTLSGHKDWINSVKFSNDSNYIISASDDNTAIVWDSHNGKEIVTLVGHKKGVKYAEFSPDGKYIVTVGKDRCIQVWDWKTVKVIYSFSIPIHDPVKIWDQDNNQIVHYQAHILFNKATFTPNGKSILAIGSDQSIIIIDLTSESNFKSYFAHKRKVISAEFSQDGKYLLTSSLDKTIRLWDFDAHTEIQIFQGDSESFVSAIFVPGENQILSISKDGSVRLWDIDTGMCSEMFISNSEGSVYFNMRNDSEPVSWGTGKNFFKLY